MDIGEHYLMEERDTFSLTVKEKIAKKENSILTNNTNLLMKLMGKEAKRMSKNTFEIDGDIISITRPEWGFKAYATVREDYLDEIQSVTWGLSYDRYPYNSKLGTLHLIKKIKQKNLLH